MSHRKQAINREETFKLIEKKEAIEFNTLNKKSDYYWEDVCNNLIITPIYKEVEVLRED